MEKIPVRHIDKVVGNVNEGKKDFLDFLDDLGKDKIEGELEKTSRDKELISFSQKCLDEYLLEFGKNDIYKIPNEKIHILPVGGIEKITYGSFKKGVASPKWGAIAVDKEPNDITFSIILFHEMYHIKNFTSINFDENELAYSERRSGFTVFVDDEAYFGLINETLNDYMCKKFFEEKIKRSNLFKKEEVDNYVFELSRNKLLDLFEQKSEEIFQKNRDQFNSKEDIKKLFFDADINGNLLPVARLIEKTFGKGKFRELGENMRK